MSKNFIKKAGIGVALGLALLPLLALAQANSGIPGPLITSPSQINAIILKILNWISALVLTIALIMLLYAAILYLTAGASETVLAKAKSVLLYAIVGIVVAVLTYSVKPFIETFFRGQF